MSAGIPSYVIQEEFCRFQGFWWQGTTHGKTHSLPPLHLFCIESCGAKCRFSLLSDDVYRIAYEEVDESEVKIHGFPSYLQNNGEVEEFRFLFCPSILAVSAVIQATDNFINIYVLLFYRFPRAGTPNSRSTLKLVEFKVSASCQIIDIRDLEMATPLSILFPWMEYLVRVGWTPESDL